MKTYKITFTKDNEKITWDAIDTTEGYLIDSFDGSLPGGYWSSLKAIKKELKIQGATNIEIN